MARLNLGILAHVDAGKTTLTERLLYCAGVIDEVGRVDEGTTRTDSLALERQRGITIKSAVVSFVVDDVTVNLIDTPGHSDFVAEVDRVLGVLDAAVLVVSAVEGVQPQTLVLFRALRRLGVPTIAFVNKIDRVGADVSRVLGAMKDRLAVEVLPMGVTHDVGTKAAGFRQFEGNDPAFATATTEVLAANDDAILGRYLDDAAVAPQLLRRSLVDQVALLEVLPTFFGVALTGVGVDEVLHAIPQLLPPAPDDSTGPPSGTVFKIERGASREKLAIVRMRSGTLRVRDGVQLGDEATRVQTVSAIEVFENATTVRRSEVGAGEIAKLHGLSGARIGDTFGTTSAVVQRTFPAPTLETAIVPRVSGEKPAVFAALTDLAEQDPLINLRQDDSRGELFLSLYGEVQKEVVAQTLQAEYGLDIEFRPTTPICIERPNRAGAAIELMPRHRSPAHPLLATVGLRISPLPPGTGVTFELDVDVKSIPIHVFDDVDTFRSLMDRTVRDALRQGLHGWEVTDCHVVMTDSAYTAPPRRWPGTTLSDYRLLTPLVVMAALKDAGTTVFEPVVEFHLEFPASDLNPVMSALSGLEARPGSSTTLGSISSVDGSIQVARFHQLQSRLPDLTHGEGVLESTLAGYRPVDGPPPSRPRTDHNPLDKADYLRRLSSHT